MQMFDPAHPGELIRETITGLQVETGNKLTVAQVANGLGTTRKTLSSIINCKQSISPEMPNLARVYRAGQKRGVLVTFPPCAIKYLFVKRQQMPYF